jgi:transcriptional regulator with XRE-family HTH domain
VGSGHTARGLPAHLTRQQINVPSPSSSARQALEALGVRLREIRLDAGLSGRDLGRLTGWHSSKVSKIEYGKQTPSVEDIQTWCKQCNAADEAPDLTASLRAMEGMFIEWRRMERTGLRFAQESVVPLWERTRVFRIYSAWLIPGPLQTQGYIAAVLTAIMERRRVPRGAAYGPETIAVCLAVMASDLRVRSCW